MGDTYELYHPVTEEAAKEFVDNTAPSDTTDEQKEQRVKQLLQGAAENKSWRESRDPAERMELVNVPFASHPPEEDQPQEDQEEGPQNPEDNSNASA